MSYFDDMKKKFGSYQTEFGEVALEQDAYIYGYCYYTACAVDALGNDYCFKWDIINHECEDQSEACDWDEFTVKKLGQ
jgi:hypothetical protein